MQFRLLRRSLRLLRYSAVAALTSCSALAYAHAADQQSLTPVRNQQVFPARKLFAEGVPNLAEVNPTLYRGGQPTPAGFQILAKMGISIVIDARGGSREGEREQVTKLGMQYVAIPWHCPFPNDKVFARFLLVIRQNRGRKIFVHCRLGDDRVGMMIAAYRMAEEGWTAEEAMQEMKAYGFTASHHLICPCLAHYEKSFPGRFQHNPEFRALHW